MHDRAHTTRAMLRIGMSPCDLSFGRMPWKWKFWEGWETPLFLKGRAPRELTVDEASYDGERYIIRATGIRYTDNWVIEVRPARNDPFGQPIHSVEVVGNKAAWKAIADVKVEIRSGRIVDDER